MWSKWLGNKWVKAIIVLHLVVVLGLVVLFFYVRYITDSNYKEGVAKAPYDVIIIPGYPYKDSTWHSIMKSRIYWSKYLYDKQYTRNIIYSGGAVHTPYKEGEIMKKFGAALGLPEQRLFAETNAEHSTENLYYGYHMAKKEGFNKIAVATDPIQTFFLFHYAKKHDLDVQFLPFPFHWQPLEKLNDPEIDPASAFVHDFIPLTRRESFIERLSGTLGNRVKLKPSDI